MSTEAVEQQLEDDRTIGVSVCEVKEQAALSAASAAAAATAANDGESVEIPDAPFAVVNAVNRTPSNSSSSSGSGSSNSGSSSRYSSRSSSSSGGSGITLRPATLVTGVKLRHNKVQAVKHGASKLDPAGMKTFTLRPLRHNYRSMQLPLIASKKRDVACCLDNKNHILYIHFSDPWDEIEASPQYHRALKDGRKYHGLAVFSHIDISSYNHAITVKMHFDPTTKKLLNSTVEPSVIGGVVTIFNSVHQAVMLDISKLLVMNNQSFFKCLKLAGNDILNQYAAARNIQLSKSYRILRMLQIRSLFDLSDPLSAEDTALYEANYARYWTERNSGGGSSGSSSNGDEDGDYDEESFVQNQQSSITEATTGAQLQRSEAHQKAAGKFIFSMQTHQIYYADEGGTTSSSSRSSRSAAAVPDKRTSSIPWMSSGPSVAAQRVASALPLLSRDYVEELRQHRISLASALNTSSSMHREDLGNVTAFVLSDARLPVFAFGFHRATNELLLHIHDPIAFIEKNMELVDKVVAAALPRSVLDALMLTSSSNLANEAITVGLNLNKECTHIINTSIRPSLIGPVQAININEFDRGLYAMDDDFITFHIYDVAMRLTNGKRGNYGSKSSNMLTALEKLCSTHCTEFIMTQSAGDRTPLVANTHMLALKLPTNLHLIQMMKLRGALNLGSPLKKEEVGQFMRAWLKTEESKNGKFG